MADPKHPLPWRVGRKVPRNLYDASGEPILMAPDAETAALIVECVNGKGVLDAGPLPEGWVFDGDETMPGYESHNGDSVELTRDSLTVGIRHSGYHTHFYTEVPLPIVMRLIATELARRAAKESK